MKRVNKEVKGSRRRSSDGVNFKKVSEKLLPAGVVSCQPCRAPTQPGKHIPGGIPNTRKHFDFVGNVVDNNTNTGISQNNPQQSPPM